MINLHESNIGTRLGWNLQPLDLQSDTLQTGYVAWQKKEDCDDDGDDDD